MLLAFRADDNFVHYVKTNVIDMDNQTSLKAIVALQTGLTPISAIVSITQGGPKDDKQTRTVESN